MEANAAVLAAQGYRLSLPGRRPVHPRPAFAGWSTSHGSTIVRVIRLPGTSARMHGGYWVICSAAKRSTASSAGTDSAGPKTASRGQLHRLDLQVVESGQINL